MPIDLYIINQEEPILDLEFLANLVLRTRFMSREQSFQIIQNTVISNIL